MSLTFLQTQLVLVKSHFLIMNEPPWPEIVHKKPMGDNLEGASGWQKLPDYDDLLPTHICRHTGPTVYEIRRCRDYVAS